MLLVILGAGASFDSVPTFPPVDYGTYGGARLPLADELFDFAVRTEFAQDVSYFPQCQPILPYLEKRDDGITVERELQRLQDEANEYPERYRQLTAIRFYLSSMIFRCEHRWNDANITKATNQKTLLDQIERWRKPDEQVCLVTFNYDRMLETALSTVGVEIQTLSDYIDNDQYKLIKLHGSTNWAREVDASKARNLHPRIASDLDGVEPWPTISAIIDHAARIKITKQYRLLSHTEHPTATLGDSPLFPAIAIPIEAKSDYECPDEHLHALLEFAPKVSKLLAIGWRGAETHFLKTLAGKVQKDVRGLVVAGSSEEANQTIERIKEAGIKGEYSALGNGFTDFIRKRTLDQLLAS